MDAWRLSKLMGHASIANVESSQVLSASSGQRTFKRMRSRDLKEIRGKRGWGDQKSLGWRDAISGLGTDGAIESARRILRVEVADPHPGGPKFISRAETHTPSQICE